MDQSNTKESRGPVSLRIKFRSANLDQFIERYAIDVSRGGIFIRTREPLAVGTQLKFDFQLQDSAPLLAGDGTVVWIREHDPARAGVTPGMGVRFDKLTPASQPVLEKILTDKAARDQSGLGGASALRVGPGGRRASSTFSAVEPMLRGAVPASPAASSPTGPLSAGGPPGAPLTLPPARSPALAARPTPPPAAAAPLTRRTPTPPVGALGAARATGLRPPLSSTGTPLVLPGARPAAPPSGGADGAAARARANTGVGIPRPAPPAPALFEPPTSEDIDKALEALKEAPAGGDARAPVAAAPSAAAPTASVVDYPSNEPTSITDLPPRPDGDGVPAARPLSLDAPPRRTGTLPLPSSVEPARPTPAASAIPQTALEPDPSDRTDQTLDLDGSSSVVQPIPPIAPPSTAPVSRFTPTGAGRVSASMPLAGDSIRQALAPKRRSIVPVIAVGAVLAAGSAAAALFFMNRAPSQKGTETAAAAPAAAALPAAAPAAGPNAAAAAVPAPEKAAQAPATAEKKPDEAPAAAAKTAEPVAPEAPKAAAAAPPAPPPAAADKSARSTGRKAAAARRRLAAKGAEAVAAAAAMAAATTAPSGTPPPAPTEGAPTPPAKVEVVGQGSDGDDKGASAKDDKDDTAAAGGSQHVLRIVSTPPGADVVVDGTSVGKTPFLGNQIDPASPHAITLKKDGYENNEHMIGSSDWSRPRNGVQTLKLTVKLRKLGGEAGGDKAKAKGADTEAAAPAAESAAPAAKKDDKKDEAPASP